TVAMVMPSDPYRCPPGPYERACMIAHYLKTKKPKSKLVIIDPKKAFSKQPVFTEAFDKYYKGIIELNLTTEIDDYAVTSLDPKTKEILTELAKKEKFPARYRNTCWSQLAPDDNVKIGANYAPKDGKLEASGGFVSQRGEAADVRKQNYPESVGWYDGITADMFAKAGSTAAPAEKKAG